MPVTTGNERGGLLRSKLGGPAGGDADCSRLDRQGIAEMPLPPAQPFTVLDLGSSEGRNAIASMGWIVEQYVGGGPSKSSRPLTAICRVIISIACS